jgi:hypothetical protein
MLLAWSTFLGVRYQFGWRGLSTRLGPVGVLLSVVSDAVYIGFPLVWHLLIFSFAFEFGSSVSSWGIGKNFLGLNFEAYPYVTLFWILYSALFHLLICIFPKGSGSSFSSTVASAVNAMKSFDKSYGRLVLNIYWACSFGMFVMVVLAADSGKIWDSSFGRFEGWTAGYIHLMFGLLKIGSYASLLSLLAFMVSGERLFEKTMVFCSLLFFPVLMESRMLGIAISGYMLVFVFNLRSRLLRMCLLPLALYIGLLANLAPLKLRSIPGTGIAPAFENTVLDPSFYAPKFDSFRFLVGNIIAGYPNALHGFSAVSRGEVVQVVPDMRFVITQFSPFPSFIDGFSRYNAYSARIFPWVPYNAHSVLYDIWKPLPFFAISMGAAVFLFIANYFHRRFKIVPVVLCFGCFCLFHAYGQQYSPRYMFRFMWLAIYVCFGVNLVMCMFGRKRLKI